MVVSVISFDRSSSWYRWAGLTSSLEGLLIIKGGNINHREAAGLYRLYVNAKLRNPIGHFYTLIGYEQPSMLFLFARLYCSMKTKSICIPRR